MLNKEGACNSTIDIIRVAAVSTEHNDLIQAVSILERFDCNNASTYHFIESDGYAETCTALVSKDSRGTPTDNLSLSLSPSFSVDMYGDSSYSHDFYNQQFCFLFILPYTHLLLLFFVSNKCCCPHCVCNHRSLPCDGHEFDYSNCVCL